MLAKRRFLFRAKKRKRKNNAMEIMALCKNLLEARKAKNIGQISHQSKGPGQTLRPRQDLYEDNLRQDIAPRDAAPSSCSSSHHTCLVTPQ